MRRDRGEHERIGIDSTTRRTTLICRWIQRGMRGVEGGEDTPPTEAAADRQRTRGHDRTSAHQVNPDLPPIRLGTGVIKNGDGRCAGPVNVAQIHHEVTDNASPGVEQMQLRLAPAQQPRRGGIVKISSRRDDNRDDRIGGRRRRHARNTGVAGGQVNAHAATVRRPGPRRQGRSAPSPAAAAPLLTSHLAERTYSARLWVPRIVSRRLTSAFATGPTPEAVARTPAGTIARCDCPTRIPGARPRPELTGAAPPLRRNQGHRHPRAPTRARRSAPTQPTPRAGEPVGLGDRVATSTG